jgi:hypothetical protein
MAWAICGWAYSHMDENTRPGSLRSLGTASPSVRGRHRRTVDFVQHDCSHVRMYDQIILSLCSSS